MHTIIILIIITMMSSSICNTLTKLVIQRCIPTIIRYVVWWYYLGKKYKIMLFMLLRYYIAITYQYTEVAEITQKYRCTHIFLLPPLAQLIADCSGSGTAEHLAICLWLLKCLGDCPIWLWKFSLERISEVI